MAQAVSNSFTRRSVVAGLALTAAPMAVLAGTDNVYAQAKQAMPEKSLYERLGGAFAIAAVVDHYRLTRQRRIAHESRRASINQEHKATLNVG